MKKFLLIFAALTLGIVGGGCGKEDMPEDALKDIQLAIANQDRQLLESRVDSKKFLNDLYSNVTNEIADNIDKFHASYPDDPYFWNTPQFIRKYNEDHRLFYMSFVDASVNAYFDKETKADNFLNIFAIQCAKEFKNICAAINTKSDAAIITGNYATINFRVTGDDTPYGQFIGDLNFKFAFEKGEDKNLNELMPALVDKAELVWPETMLNK